MKKRKQIISILLSTALILGLCASELAVQEVDAQEVSMAEQIPQNSIDENEEGRGAELTEETGENQVKNQETEREGEIIQDEEPDENAKAKDKEMVQSKQNQEKSADSQDGESEIKVLETDSENLLQIKQIYVDGEAFDYEDVRCKFDWGTQHTLKIDIEEVEGYTPVYEWSYNDTFEGGELEQNISEQTIYIYSQERTYFCDISLCDEDNTIVESTRVRFDIYCTEDEDIIAEGDVSCVPYVQIGDNKKLGTMANAVVGDTVTLYVNAKSMSDSQLSYKWYRMDGNEKESLGNSGTQYTYEFNMKCTDGNWREEFICEITSDGKVTEIEFGVYPTSTLTVLSKINGQYSYGILDIGIVEYTNRVEIGKECTIEVEPESAYSNSKYTYQWYSYTDGEFDEETATLIEGENRSSYTFIKKDWKPEYYICKISDGNEEANQEFEIVNDLLKVKTYIDGKIYYMPERKELELDSQHILNVEAKPVEGYELQYKWYYENYETDETQPLGTESEQKITIGAEYKYYMCEVQLLNQKTKEIVQSEEFEFYIEPKSSLTYRQFVNNNEIVDEDGKCGEFDEGTKVSLRVEAKSDSDNPITYKWYQPSYEEETETVLGTEAEHEVEITNQLWGQDYICEISDGRMTEKIYFRLDRTSSVSGTVWIDGEKIGEGTSCAKECTYGKTYTLKVQAESTDGTKLNYSWEHNWESVKGAFTNELTVTKGRGKEEYICRVNDGYDTQYFYFTLMSDSLKTTAKINEEVSDTISLNDEEKAVLSVDAISSHGDAQIKYQWYYAEDSGKMPIIYGERSSSIEICKRGSLNEQYMCCVQDGDDEENVRFYIYENEEVSCEHVYENSVIKATLGQDGSITSRCSKCGKINSVTAIPYPKNIELSSASFIYNGKVQKPIISVIGSDGKIIDSSNYTVSYPEESKDVGEYTVTVTFRGNYSGSVNKTYTIKRNTQSATEVGNTLYKVSKITLAGISKKVAAGKKIKLTASILPENANNKAITWASSNTKVATVNSSGTVTMKKNSGGKSVTITATASDGSGVKATYKIKSMKGVVKKVTVSGNKSVKAGKSLKLKAKVTASKKANTKLKWTSSNTKYATVSGSGKVKTYKAGKGKQVKITAMATDGSGKKKTFKIKIK